MWPLLKRDIILTARSRSIWLTGIAFFVAFLTLCAIALGGDLSVLRPLAPALIWLAVLLSVLLSFNSMFKDDLDSGQLEQLVLSGLGTLSITLSKMMAYAICITLPLIIAALLAGIGFNLSVQTNAAIMISLFFAAPGLSAYAVFTSALLTGQRNSGLVALLITTPFVIPIIIFAIAAVEAYPSLGIGAPAFQALLGVSLVGCALAIPASASILSTLLDD